ncbi:MAG: sulfotransferase [Bacteroidetes bacterium]|nr:sulfotransferase [Bacteroidota bacterium]
MFWFRHVITLIQKLFLGFEKPPAGWSYDLPVNKQPIFIVGAPRSGTTFVFQMLLKQFELTYISNLMAMFPAKMGSISSSSLLNYKEIKESKYGYIGGMNGPNEAGPIQTLWFDRLNTPQQDDAIRWTISKISKKANAPILIKNTYNSLRIENIHRVFPKARFIFLKRQTLYNAQSLLKGRLELKGTIEEWFSTKPPHIGTDDLDPFQQVIEQVEGINKLISEQIIKYSLNAIKLEYTSFCKDPQKILQGIGDEFGLSEKNNPVIISDVLFKESKNIDDPMWSKLQEAVEKSKATKTS